MTTSTWRAGTLLLSLTLGLLAACSPRGSTQSDPRDWPEEADGPVWFEDVTDQVGLDFVHDPGPTGDYFMPQSMGSGCAFLHDADDTLYVYLIQNAGPKSAAVNRLYKRLPDGTFRDVTGGSGLGVAGYNMGVAVGDVNNDGLPDVLLTQYGGIKLFLNQGGGHFADVTEEAGLANANPLWAMSAAFLDYDRDGRLDFVVVNYLDYDPKTECLTPKGARDFCAPGLFPGTCSKLFRNLGPGAPGCEKPGARVRFEDVSFASGIGRLPGPGLGVFCADFDGDGWPDVFVANDGAANRLWMNRRDGTFIDEAASRGVARTMTGKEYAGMGVAVGDTRSVGAFDLYVTHLGHETNTLWRQRQDTRPGHFRDQTVAAGLTATRWRGTGFGTLMADFDLDGAVDIAVVNGRVYFGGPARDTGLGFWEPYAERNQLLANDGTGQFRDLSPANKALCGRWNVARGLACADFDDDGAPDLLVTAVGDRARLFRNVAPGRGHWLKVRALDPDLKRDAYGAEVRVRAGGRDFLRLLNPAESYLCSSSPVCHFGLGRAAEVESITVTWPGGVREVFPRAPATGPLPADRLVELRKGEGRAP
jgi:enediyne biosynthesis protein E4